MKIRDTEFYYGIPVQHFFIEIYIAASEIMLIQSRISGGHPVAIYTFMPACA